MGILDTLKEEVRKGFAGQLLTGTLRRVVVGATNDEFGDPVASTYTDYSFEGFPDTYSAFYRANAGIPDTDVKILVIAGSLAVRPKKDDRIYLRSRWYQVRAIRTDPAEATFDLQSFEIKAPV